jgi:hypothetical protein
MNRRDRGSRVTRLKVRWPNRYAAHLALPAPEALTRPVPVPNCPRSAHPSSGDACQLGDITCSGEQLNIEQFFLSQSRRRPW